MNSKEKLYDVYYSLVHNYGADCKEAKTLKEVLMAEENSAVRGGIRITDYTDKRKVSGHPAALTGVHYENGNIVATDARVLMVLTGQSYPEELEGKTVSKDGGFIEGKYPKWEAVFPDSKCQTEMGPDWGTVRKDLEEVKFGLKSRTSQTRSVSFDGKFRISVDYMPLMLGLQKSPGISRIAYTDERRPVTVEGPGYRALFMPVLEHL